MTHRVVLPLAGCRAYTFVGSACCHRRFSADFAVAGVGRGFISGEGGGWLDHTAGSASDVFLGERNNTAVLFGQAYKQEYGVICESQTIPYCADTIVSTVHGKLVGCSAQKLFSLICKLHDFQVYFFIMPKNGERYYVWFP